MRRPLLLISLCLVALLILALPLVLAYRLLLFPLLVVYHRLRSQPSLRCCWSVVV